MAFPEVQSVLSWYNSAAYQDNLKHRHANSDTATLMAIDADTRPHDFANPSYVITRGHSVTDLEGRAQYVQVCIWVGDPFSAPAPFNRA